jgi:hypothetical protein
MSFLLRFTSLLIVLAVLGWLAKSQLSGQPAPRLPESSPVAVPTGTPQQVQQQYKQALEQAMQPKDRDRSEP